MLYEIFVPSFYNDKLLFIIYYLVFIFEEILTKFEDAAQKELECFLKKETRTPTEQTLTVTSSKGVFEHTVEKSTSSAFLLDKKNNLNKIPMMEDPKIG